MGDSGNDLCRAVGAPVEDGYDLKVVLEMVGEISGKGAEGGFDSFFFVVSWNKNEKRMTEGRLRLGRLSHWLPQSRFDVLSFMVWLPPCLTRPEPLPPQP